nr:unnamed protein product [Digitaria exilis]
MATSSAAAGARKKKAPSPPKHRHDGTSPLPLGMDWSPPPKRWLKSAFPKKDVPSAPPKHAFLRINSSRLLLEERRHALEEWMQKLLSDIDLSRSAPVAAFLELEAAARSYFQDRNGRPSEAGSSAKSSSGSSPHADGSASDSLAESNQINQALNRGSSLTGATGNGVLGESILDQSDEHVSSISNHRKGNLVFLEHDGRNGSAASHRGVVSEEDHDSNPGHARKDSAESIGSDLSSLRGSELSVPGASSSLWDGPVNGHISQTEHLTGLDMQLLYDVDAQVILPNDQNQKLSRLMITMQRRIGTAKTDMEDLIARLNQEAAVKDYLTTKVKDLEVELEATKQKGRETLQQAILAERERITQMQWDMDELRRKYSEMESNLKIEQNEKTHVETEKTSVSGENETLLEELEMKQKEVESLKQHLGEVEAKSKADIKVLVKEVKSLRNSQKEMKKVLNQYLEEKTDLEAQLLARDDEQGSSDDGDNSDSRSSLTMSSEEANVTDEDTTKMLSDLLIDNAQLRMRLNGVIRNAVNTAVKPEKEGSGEVLPKKTVLNWLLDR